jgi:4-hydroxy-3-methylbut-2-enyl diphosphate reductase
MRIIIAKEAGFCFGVKRAANLVLDKKHKGKKINTIGPLIHNNQFIKHLEKNDIKVVNKKEDADAEKIVIRSHGITKEEQQELEKDFKEIIDATCPFVKKVHNLAEDFEKRGFQVFIFGEDKHPEVLGIKSYAKNATSIMSIDDIKKFDKNLKIALLSQTTQNLRKFQELSEYIQNNFENFEIVNTICDATEKRQEAAKELAKKVDVMIVIGGKHSSNTSRLYDVSSKIVKSFHIETEDELKKEWFFNISKVGITAGASTPDFIIEKVIKKIKTYENS